MIGGGGGRIGGGDFKARILQEYLYQQRKKYHAGPPRLKSQKGKLYEEK